MQMFYRPIQVEPDIDVLIENIKTFFQNNYGINDISLKRYGNKYGILATIDGTNIIINMKTYPSGAISSVEATSDYGDSYYEEYEEYVNEQYFYDFIFSDIVTPIIVVIEKNNSNPNESLARKVTESIIRKLRRLN